MNIKVSLSAAGISRAQKDLARYKQDVKNRVNRFVARLAELGMTVATIRFQAAQYDGDNDVAVYVEADGRVARVVAEGKAVAFIEFGTGVRYPEHASGTYAHGTYGKGQGANPKGWIYKGDPGTGGIPVLRKDGSERDGVYRTFGNPPAEAMWTAATDMASQITQVWEEVMRG